MPQIALAMKNQELGERMPPQSARLLTLEELSEELRVSQKGIRRLEARGKVKLVRIGRRVLCTRAEFERLMRDGAPLDEE